MFAKIILVYTLLYDTVYGQGYIWLITDFHYDPTYTTLQESCNIQIPPEQLGQFGHVECDSPWDLVERAVEGMSELGHEPDMIYWIGDSAHHVKQEDLLNEGRVADALEKCSELIMNNFPGTEIYPIMGNHDYYPTSDLPGEPNDIYVQTAALWDDWLREPQAKETFIRGSYYTLLSQVDDKLRIVAINTNLYLEYNEATSNDPDPAGQLEWLDNVMTTARNNGEKVQLLTHVPTGTYGGDEGVRWIREPFNTQLNHLYRKYADITVGLHSAHEHMDSFRMVYAEDSGDPLAVMLIAPSVSPWRAYLGPGNVKEARNPALRAIKYDTTTLQIIDIEQYYVNLTAANLQGKATWLLEYSYSDSYGVENVGAVAMHNLLTEFKEEDSNKWQLYYKYNTVSTEHESVDEFCDCECKRNHICSIEFINFTSYDACIESESCDGSRAGATHLGAHLATLLMDLLCAALCHFLLHHL